MKLWDCGSNLSIWMIQESCIYSLVLNMGMLLNGMIHIYIYKYLNLYTNNVPMEISTCIIIALTEYDISCTYIMFVKFIIRVGKFFPWSEKNTEISGYFRKGKKGVGRNGKNGKKTHSVVIFVSSYTYYLHVLQITQWDKTTDLLIQPYSWFSMAFYCQLMETHCILIGYICGDVIYSV